MPKINAVSAIVDIKGGQEPIFAKLEGRPTIGECPKEFRIPVTITGYIDYHYGDDGEGLDSFIMVVESSAFEV